MFPKGFNRDGYPNLSFPVDARILTGLIDMNDGVSHTSPSMPPHHPTMLHPDSLVASNMLGANPVALPTNLQSNPGLDSIIQVHRRKMQRRQANRRSAQLSRARKKAHLEGLKHENSRLQKLVDILDSQSEFIFCVTAAGKISYISERIANAIKSASDDPDEEIIHVSQLLTPESVETLFDSIRQLISEPMGKKPYAISHVKEVFYQDATGFPVVGYMRCSRLVRTVTTPDVPDDESKDHEQSDDGSAADAVMSLKKMKSETGDDHGSHQSDETLEKHSSSGSAGSGSSNDRTTSSSNAQTSNDSLYSIHGAKMDIDPECEGEEFVCVVRPASASSPHHLNNLHLLSAASMVAHDSQQRGKSKENKEERTGSPLTNGSNGSDSNTGSSGVPNSSRSSEEQKNSTSSETADSGSDDQNSTNADI